MKTARGTATLGLLLALAILAVPSNGPTRWEDRASAMEIDPRGGPPFHLLSEEAQLEAIRALGYRWGMISLSSGLQLLFSVLDRGESPFVQYLSGRVLRDAETVARGTGNPAPVFHLRAILRDRETMRWFHGVREFEAAWTTRLQQRHDTSIRTRRLIEQEIADLDAHGFRAFSGEAYEFLADCYFASDSDSQALRCLDEARACHAMIGHTALLSHVMGRIGYFHLEKGDLGAAEQALLESYGYAASVNDPYHISRSLAYLSTLRQTQGRYADAESLLVRSLDMARQLHDPVIDLARVTELAKLYESLGKHELFSELVDRGLVLATQKPKYGPYVFKPSGIFYYEASCLALKARVQVDDGAYPEAVMTMKRALAIGRKNPDRTLEAELIKQLGDAYAAAGRDRDAIGCYETARAHARKLKEFGREAEYLMAAGELFIERGELARATACLAQTVRCAREHALAREHIEALHLLSRAESGLGRPAYAEKLLATAIVSFEQRRAEKRFVDDRHSLTAIVREILNDLIVLKSERGAPCDSLVLASEMETLLSSNGRDGESGTREREIVERMRSRDWIPRDAIILRYVATPERLIVAAIDRDHAEYRSIGVSRERLGARTETFIESCAGSGPGLDASAEGSAPDTVAAQARALYRVLLGPVESLISGKSTLCIICDEPLRRLPFGALIDPSSEGRFLIEDKKIIASPGFLGALSGRDRIRGSRPVGGPSRSLVVGKPDIGMCVARNYPSLRELPGARGEAGDIGQAFGPAVVLAGPDATKEAVLAALPKADVIHVATHRVTYPANSGRSALLLATKDDCDPSAAVEPSLLTENEISKLALPRARTVVLATCESGTGSREQPGECIGLSGAFLKAGARTVVATIWPIEDRSAREFVASFYRELKERKEDPAAALQAAQKSAIAANRRAGAACDRIWTWAPYLAVGPF